MILAYTGILIGVIVAIAGFLYHIVPPPRRWIVAIIGLSIAIFVVSFSLGRWIERHNSVTITAQLGAVLKEINSQEQDLLAGTIKKIGIEGIIIRGHDGREILLIGTLVNEQTGEVLNEDGVMKFSIEGDIPLPEAIVTNGKIRLFVDTKYRDRTIIWSYKKESAHLKTKGIGVFRLNEDQVPFTAVVRRTRVKDQGIKPPDDGTIVIQGSIKDDQGNPVVGAIVSYRVSGIPSVYPPTTSLAGGQVVIELDNTAQDRIICITVRSGGKIARISFTVDTGQHFEVIL